jgi:leucyl aminopeptidase
MTPVASALNSWILSSKFSFCLASHSGVNASSEHSTPRVVVHVGLDSETEDAWLVAARAVAGDFKPKVCVFAGRADDGSGQWACVVPASLPRKIGGHSLGARGLSTLQGAIACAGLLALPAGAVPKDGVLHVRLSKALCTSLEQTQEEFLTGFLQRAHTLKKGTSQPLKVSFESLDVSAEAFSAAQSACDAMTLARSLVNMPANILNPETYEHFVRELVKSECARAQNPNHLSVEVFHAERLAADGCGLLCAVGKGSDVTPRLLKLQYTPVPSSRASRHVVLVGKGITFDTGGLDVKPSNFMRNMKKDMGGSAAALGAFLSLTRRQVPLRLTCYLALAENMVSGASMRPGDVYTARNGVSVEIDNTDAEGRLVLADALCYAAEEKPDWIVDLATLTGAARTALGGGVDALFSNDKAAEDLLFRTGLEVADPVWPLPLVDDYEALLDSSVADCANSSTTPQGGAITAALFLRKFVGKVPWSHIDTYMWTDRAGDLFAEPGATAKCVRLVDASVRAFASKGNLASAALN